MSELTRKSDASPSQAPLALNRCSATTTRGAPCPQRPMVGATDGKCYMHTASVSDEERHAARARGGHATARHLPADVDIPSLVNDDGALQLLDLVTKAVLRGEVTPQQCQATVAAVSAATRLAEARLAAQVTDLELQVARNKREGRR